MINKERLKQDWKRFGWFGISVLIFIYICQFLDIPLCPVKFFTGYPCPFCGTTRASILLLTGHFIEALRMNPLVYECILFGIIFFLCRYVWDHPRIILISLICIAVITCIVYMLGMYTYFPNVEPDTYAH